MFARERYPWCTVVFGVSNDWNVFEIDGEVSAVRVQRRRSANRARIIRRKDQRVNRGGRVTAPAHGQRGNGRAAVFYPGDGTAGSNPRDGGDERNEKQ